MVYSQGINTAVKSVVQEMKSANSDFHWQKYSEEELIHEFVVCILGSRVKYEISVAASIALKEENLFHNPMSFKTKKAYERAILKVLKRPLFHSEFGIDGVRYRFANSRANYIADTIWNVYSNENSLKGLLTRCESEYVARKLLISIGKGIGPKQASMFLRDIGYSSNLAIIDSHVKRYLELHNYNDMSSISTGVLKHYEKHERLLRDTAVEYGCSLGAFDRAVWIVMRVYLKEFAN